MWWVLTDQQTNPGYTSLTVLATTNVADHLFMAWGYHKPARHPIYKRVRGVSILCGYKWIWDTPFITEQIQHGDTTYHTLHNSALIPASTIWFYLFAPDGPYGLQIQGPLTSVTLPYMPGWTTPIYVATRAKGVYYTPLFTPPGGPQPIWTPVNEALHSLATWQICPDKLDPAGRHYLLTDDYPTQVLYRRQPAIANCWVPVLTAAAAAAAIGSTWARLTAIDTSIHHPGYLYALADPDGFDTRPYCFRSDDYGETWAHFLIVPLTWLHTSFNLYAGNTLHAALGHVFNDTTQIFSSLDLGATWLPCPAIASRAWDSKLRVDPTNESIVYIGISVDAPDPNELYRQTAYLGPLAQVDASLHLGPAQSQHVSPPWIDPANNTFLRTLQDDRIYTTTNYCATWTNHGAPQYPVHLLAQLPTYPDRLYLALSHPFHPPGPDTRYHTLFTSIDNGTTMYPKSGNHPHLSDGGEDSIPYDCAGAAQAGIMFAP